MFMQHLEQTCAKRHGLAHYNALAHSYELICFIKFDFIKIYNTVEPKVVNSGLKKTRFKPGFYAKKWHFF
jgi:hypothetical protein